MGNSKLTNRWYRKCWPRACTRRLVPAFLVFLSVSAAMGCMVLTEKDQELELLRKQIDSISATKSDLDFVEKLAEFSNEWYRHSTVIRHGEWYPVAEGAMISVAKEQAVRLRSQDDSIETAKISTTWFLSSKGSWYATQQKDIAAIASANVTERYVFVVDFSKGTVAVINR